MTHDHVTESPGRLRVDGRIGVTRLFGLPFLLVGLWFLMQFLGGAWGVLKREVVLVDAAAGLLGLLLAAVVFGVPGFLILLLRRYVVLDTGMRTVEEVKDFHLARRARSTPLSEIREVLVRWEECGSRGGKEGDRSSCLATVRLVKADGEGLFLSHDASAVVSLDLAQKAAALANLPLRDETREGGEEEG